MTERDDARGRAAPAGGDTATSLPGKEPTAKIRRFYHQVARKLGDDGHVLHLDDRPARTPGRRALALPTVSLADAVVEEWAGQGSYIEPAVMPLTRIANTVIDGVAQQVDAVREEIVKYAGSDLLCYRAESPRELVARQGEIWDPILAWARDDLGADLIVAEGIMPVTQSAAAINAVRTAIAELDTFRLGPAHVMTTLTGSTVLALAHLRGRLTAEAAWTAAHLDEDWQIALWGEDAEATARREGRWREMAAASRFAELAAQN